MPSIRVIHYGLGPIAHIWLQPDRPEYKAVESRIVRYDYDVRRATQTIESLGYSRGADGVFVDGANQRLRVEIRTTIRAELQPKIVAAVVGFWRESGIEAEQVNIPPQRQNDREYRATFPALSKKV